MVSDSDGGSGLVEQLFRRHGEPICFEDLPSLEHQIPVHVAGFAVFLYDELSDVCFHIPRIFCTPIMISKSFAITHDI